MSNLARQYQRETADTTAGGRAKSIPRPTQPISGTVLSFARCDARALSEALSGVSPSDLSRWTGLSATQCRRILAGERGMGVDMLARLPEARRKVYGAAVATGHQIAMPWGVK